MTNFKHWIRAVRAPFFTVTIVPIMFGAIVAWYDTAVFAWSRFWWTLAGALLIHTGTNVANDYFDHRSGCDEANPTPTPFSGGSRVIQGKLITPQAMLRLAVTAFVLGAAIGLYLNAVSKGNVILLLGIVGVFLGFFYTAKPFRIGYGSLGELAVGIGFGPLMVIGSYYVQAQVLPVHVVLISLPVGILVALILYINEFPDHQADASVGKRTLVVILGKHRAMRLYLVLLASVYVLIAGLVGYGFLPRLCLVAFVSVPLACKAWTVAQRHVDAVYELLPANAATIGLHTLIGLLLSAGVVLDKLLL